MINSLYIHIPFCKKKCLYCDFNSFDNQSEKIANYMEALYSECAKFSFDTLKTIYIGGGTPSFIDSKYIVKLLDMLPKASEVTIEMNPCTVTLEKLLDYKKAGINRISIGLQTTNDNILKEIGRAHDFETFKNTYNLVRDVGFNNVNVDLMFGLPNQTLEDVKASIEYLKTIKPEHISCYSLIVHSNIFENLPSDIEERKMYYYIKEALNEAGYIQYEISNFSKAGYESKHNLAYWNQEEYIGLGAGASSYVSNVRYTNEPSIEKYIYKIKNNQDVKNIEEVQQGEDKLREYIILRLRLMEGINIFRINQLFNIDIKSKFKIELEKLKNQNLIEISENIIKLTEKGMDFANVVWREFI